MNHYVLVIVGLLVRDMNLVWILNC